MSDAAPPARRFGAEADLDRAIDGLVARGQLALPPYPGIAARIAAMVRRGDYGLDALARLIRSDPALAAGLLRVAGAAQPGAGPIVSLERAMARVGAAQLERIALASALGAGALGRGPLAPLRRSAWRDALASAVLARELARLRGVDPEEAFACGLLHDLGRVVAIGAIERIAAGSRAMPAHFWEQIVERHHVRLGRILAERWELPALVLDAIRLHHGEDLDDGGAPGMLGIVRVTDAALRLLGDRGGATEADLALVSGLTSAEADGIGRALRVLPAFVASLDGTPEPQGPALDAGAGRARRGPGVHVRIAGQDWVAIGVGPHQLVVRGAAPLPERDLVEVEALDGRGRTFHARVLLAWPDGGAFGAVLMPFGLSGPALLDWQGLVPASATA